MRTKRGSRRSTKIMLQYAVTALSRDIRSWLTHKNDRHEDDIHDALLTFCTLIALSTKVQPPLIATTIRPLPAPHVPAAVHVSASLAIRSTCKADKIWRSSNKHYCHSIAAVRKRSASPIRTVLCYASSQQHAAAA
eukprot:21244-Heterococcus_DN1.PRE.2